MTRWAKSPAAARISARTPPALTKAKKKKALERCFEQPVPAEVYDALARQLAAVAIGGRTGWQRIRTTPPQSLRWPRQDALYQAVSLCRKAGALTMGFDAVEDACVKSKAWLVMVASDASAKTVQRLNYAVGDLVDVIPMPLTQDRAGRYQPQAGGGVCRDRPQPRKALL